VTYYHKAKDTRLVLGEWISKKQIPFLHRTIKTMLEKLTTRSARLDLGNSLSISNHLKVLPEPEVGDLVSARCELNFASHDTFMVPKEYWLPVKLEEQFKATGQMIPGNSEICARDVGFTPILFLDVYLDISLLSELTHDDYEQSMMETKLWDFESSRGFVMKDYMRVRNKPQHISKEYVEFFSFCFRDGDILAEMPNLFETRKEKFWFYGHDAPNMYKNPVDKTKERLIKMPSVGVTGLLLEKKTLLHSFINEDTGNPNYVKGDRYKTTFYKILFNNRQPLWTDALVVKINEEDKLDLPIYLPVL
jgi:hypothetical protein